MRKLRYFPFVVALLMAACVSQTPAIDTLNKRFATFEIGYKNALAEVDALERSKSFTPATANKVADLVEELNKARKTAMTAKDAGDVFKADDNLATAIAVLDKLREVLPQKGKI